MAISTKPNINILWAESGSFEPPEDSKIEQGWVAEIPPYETQNWWQHRADQALRHIFEAGIPVWDANTLYTANRSIVQSSDGTLWRALIDNTGQDPLLTSGTWGTLFQPNKYVPPGAIMAFPTITPPDGWLVCDGAAISRTAYPDLFALIGTTWGVGDGVTTFNKPDLRGMFLRGFDAGRGVDPGRTFASQQTGQNLQHSHSGTTLSGGNHSHSGSAAAAGNHNHTGSTSVNGDHAHGVPAGINGGYMFGGSSGVGNNGTMAGGPPAFLGYIGFGSSWSSYGATGNAGNHNHSLNVDFNGGHTHTLTVNAGGDHTHNFATGLGGGGTESRPINIAIQYCIKF